MEPTPRSSMGRSRAIGVWALIVVASLLLAGTSTSYWLKRQVLDTDHWVAASDEILADPTVQAALATYVVDQLYANVDLAGQLSERLPPDLQGLAAPLVAGLRQPATAGVERLFATSRVQQLWSTANRIAHEKLVAALEDDGTFVSTTGGTVTLELGAVIEALGEQLGVPQSALDRIPPDAGDIVIVQSDQLALAQTAVTAIRWMALVLGLVVVALYAAAVALATGARRRTLRNVGWSVVVVGLVVLAVRRVAGNYVTSMASDPTVVPAVRSVYAIVSELLAATAWSVVTWGLVLVVGCVLAGPTRAARRVREAVAPVLNQRIEAVAVGAAVVYLLVLLWAPVPAVRAWGSALGLAVVLAVGLYLLRRRTLAEFPDADLGEAARAARARAGSAWHRVGAAVGRSSSPSEQGASGADGTGDPTAGLERLADLHRRGALDDAEFAAAKAKLLA